MTFFCWRRGFVYTALRFSPPLPPLASASPQSIRQVSLPPVSFYCCPANYQLSFSSFSLLSLPLLSSPLHSSSPLLSSSHTSLCLRSLALFDRSLSLDSPGCIQVKLLIASAVGGVRRRLTAAQPVPVLGGLRWGGVIGEGEGVQIVAGVCEQTAPGTD